MSSAPTTPSAAYASPLAQELAADVLDRFLRYVRIDTQAVEGSASYPSSEKQLDLSRLLLAEPYDLGLEDAELTEHGYVFATLPGTVERPVVGLIAHVDTTPEVAGGGVQPIVHAAYAGGRIVLPGDEREVLDPQELDELAARVGHDIVTSDGIDAPRRRRQGGRGRDHGGRHVPSGTRSRTCARARRVHCRRGGRPWDGPFRSRAVQGPVRVHPRRSGIGELRRRLPRTRSA